MTDLHKLSLSAARDGLKNKDFTATELVESHIAQMELHRGLNAFITETPEKALEMAATSDAHLAKGQGRPLEGLPLVIKDMFCTEGVRTTAASAILKDFIPPYESTVTRHLWNDGAVLLGKSNCDEFAMGSSNLTSSFGAVKNPWRSLKAPDENLVPGGSSGGSAAAMAAEIGVGALGTDTGGSIRQPASFTGTVGIKPTYGRCSRWGIVAFASSLDQAGPMTRTVRDAAILLESMAGHDPKDATSVNLDVPNYERHLMDGVKGLKIGIPKEYQVDGLSSDIQAMWDQGAAWLKEAGAEITPISLPHTRYALPVYYILAPAEASSNLARYDGVRFTSRVEGKTLDEMYELTRAKGFGEEVKRRILIGTYVLSAGYYDAYYLKAQKIRRLIKQDFDAAFKKVDLILTPSTPNAAFSVTNPPKDPVQMYLNDVLTVTVNLAGLPGISVPAALTKEGLPLGLQLIGDSFQESLIFRAAETIEQAASFKDLAKDFRRLS